jgi:hypothetical protein
MFSKIKYCFSQSNFDLQRIETKMAAISADIAQLLTTTSAIVTDTATVLADLAAEVTMTPDQQTTLENAIASLQAVDVNLQSVINPPAPPSP